MRTPRVRRLLVLVLLVKVTVGTAVSAQVRPPKVAKPTGTGVIAGKVSKAATGEPLRGARVALHAQGAEEGGYEGSEVVTNESGEFAFSGLAAGAYALFVERTGYVKQQYGERPSRFRLGSSGTPLTLLAGQEMRDLEFKMVAGGVITGRVYDRYGDVAEGAQVNASQFTRGRALPVGRATTNDLGEYRLYGLAPGEYVVSASPRDTSSGAFYGLRSPGGMARVTAQVASEPREVGGQTYYPGVAEAAHASKLEVAPGQEIGGIEITIRAMRVYNVRGRVSLPEKVKAEHVHLILVGKEGFGDMGGRGVVEADGTFVIPNVPSGSYRLMGVAMDPAQGLGGSFSAQMEVTVANSDVEGLHIALGGGAEVSGRLQIEGKTTLPANASVTLVTRGTEGFGGGHGLVKDDGTFLISNVTPGTYMVSTTAAMGDGGYYLKEARLGGQNVRESLQVSGAISGLELVLASDGGTLSGRVLTEENLPATGAIVVLVAGDGKGAAWVLDGKWGQADQHGRFIIKAIRPGEYKLVATEDTGAYELRGDGELPKEVLEQATSVRIDASGQHTVEVRTIRLKK